MTETHKAPKVPVPSADSESLKAEIANNRFWKLFRNAFRLHCPVCKRGKVFPALFRLFPDVQFYDYTKSHGRMLRFLRNRLPVNYHLTYSLSEKDGDIDMAVGILRNGGNVAAVFRTAGEIPESYRGFQTVPADSHDATFFWGESRWLALKAKGKARHDTTGFVIDVEAR